MVSEVPKQSTSQASQRKTVWRATANMRTSKPQATEDSNYRSQGELDCLVLSCKRELGQGWERVACRASLVFPQRPPASKHCGSSCWITSGAWTQRNRWPRIAALRSQRGICLRRGDRRGYREALVRWTCLCESLQTNLRVCFCNDTYIHT